jgi:hypothetical protein
VTDSVPSPRVPRATERFHWSGRELMVYSERLPIKYLVSNHGISFGIDSARTSFLFLACRDGVFLRTRPVGDTVVEDLDYEIPAIARALKDQDRHRPGGRA